MKKTLLFTLLLLNPLLSQDTIEVHTCYGNAHELIVEGRLLDEHEFKERSKEDSWFKNLWKKLQQVVNSEIKDAPMTLIAENESYYTKSDDEGYFEFDIQHRNSSFINNESIQLSLDKKELSTTCSALILEEKEQVGIISDFDDTVIVSGVTHKLDLINNIFFKNYKQREVVSGMAERFKKILAQNDSSKTTALFFTEVTHSKKQL